jgi:hypothetical protein
MLRNEKHDAVHSILVAKSLVILPLVKARRKWENRVKMLLRDIGREAWS